MPSSSASLSPASRWPAVASWFSRTPAPLLGIDISASSVKLVELGLDRRGRRVLERCALEPLERGWVVDGSVERFDEVARAMARAVQASGSRTRQVAMALPASAVITKTILLPRGLSESELESQVQAEASQYIPFSLDEVSLDFSVNPASAAGDASEVEVLIAASRRDRVQDRQALAEAAGLRPRILDVETFASRLAASRLVGQADTAGGQGAAGDEVLALFDVGAASTKLQVLCGDEMLYDSEQTSGGLQLTQQIARHFGLSFAEAEARKCSGNLPAAYEDALLKPFVETLAQDIVRSLQFFFTSTAHARVDRVLLAGGCAALPGLPEAVALHAACPCSRLDPFQDMALASTAQALGTRADVPAFLTACGLALRRFLP